MSVTLAYTSNPHFPLILILPTFTNPSTTTYTTSVKFDAPFSSLLITAVIIASYYILPLFDYCNNLLFNLPAYKLIKLLRLQNYVVRCIHLLPRRSSDSITPLLKQLQWLPVSYRIKYKLSLIIHKAIHHNSPTTLPPFAIYTHPLLQSTPDPQTAFSLLHPTYTTSTPTIYAICPICHLSMEFPTLPPSNNDIKLLLQTSSKYILKVHNKSTLHFLIEFIFVFHYFYFFYLYLFYNIYVIVIVFICF